MTKPKTKRKPKAPGADRSVTTIDNALEPINLRPCSVCGGPAQDYSRWKLVGTELKLIYSWVECAGCPPCETGKCFKDGAMAVASWNKGPDKPDAQAARRKGGES